MGFATSMLVFPIMTYWYLGEPMTFKSLDYYYISFNYNDTVIMMFIIKIS